MVLISIRDDDGGSIFSQYGSLSSPASGKENVRFPDSPDFENLPDFRTGRDLL